MRKFKISARAEKIKEQAEKLGIYCWGDNAWSIAEASMMETPTGVTHLHWKNHLGQGKWVFVQKRSWVCNTVRCRIVYITPLGHESEACRIDQTRLEEIQDAYHRAAFMVDHPPSAWEINRRIEKIMGMTAWELAQEGILVGNTPQ